MSQKIEVNGSDVHPLYKYLKNGKTKAGWAVDSGAAVHFKNGVYHKSLKFYSDSLLCYSIYFYLILLLIFYILLKVHRLHHQKLEF